VSLTGAICAKCAIKPVGAIGQIHDLHVVVEGHRGIGQGDGYQDIKSLEIRPGNQDGKRNIEVVQARIKELLERQKQDQQPGVGLVCSPCSAPASSSLSPRSPAIRPNGSTPRRTSTSAAATRKALVQAE
jgi:hypothetical protein